MRVLLALLLLLCLPTIGSAIPTTSDALEIKLLAETYHIAVSYNLSGYDPLTDQFLVVGESYESTSPTPSSNSFSSPNLASASAGRFAVSTDASAGSNDWVIVDDTLITVEGGFNQANALSEATWSFRIPEIGDYVLPIDYYGSVNYFEDWAKITLQVSLAKNGDLAFSQSLFSGANTADDTLMLDFIGSTPGDRWDLTFRAGYLVYDFDEQHLRISTNLRPVPEPTTLLLLGSGLLGMVALRRNLKS